MCLCVRARSWTRARAPVCACACVCAFLDARVRVLGRVQAWCARSCRRWCTRSVVVVYAVCTLCIRVVWRGVALGGCGWVVWAVGCAGGGVAGWGGWLHPSFSLGGWVCCGVVYLFSLSLGGVHFCGTRVHGVCWRCVLAVCAGGGVIPFFL